MYAPLILGVCVFAVILFLRIQTWRAKPEWSSPQQRMKTARVLVVAVLTFLAIAMRLHWTIEDLDGKPRAPLNWWEQMLSKY